MLPIVIRSAEVVLLLVPDSLREAALALGAPRWRVVPGRAADGAPGPGHRVAAGRRPRRWGRRRRCCSPCRWPFGLTGNLGAQMNTLPLQIYNDITNRRDAIVVARAWGAALTLVVLVLILNLIARAVSRRSRMA